MAVLNPKSGIEHTANFKQDTLPSSFNLKDLALSIADAFRNIHFSPHF